MEVAVSPCFFSISAGYFLVMSLRSVSFDQQMSREGTVPIAIADWQNAIRVHWFMV
jgi:hypothetical protein